ncbi:SpoIIE family protein phosphatase [Nonomuraea fuscirosea]|uniref:SpoIIE family protein phosphatase n=1 Tax=Nonomuraea fuscirosea TaxID=1291556 RepID=UPI0034369851
MPASEVAAHGAANDSSRLDELLIGSVTRTGAHVGAVYVLDRSGNLLRMVTEVGLPTPIARSFARIRMAEAMPISVAVREQRFIWITGREHLAREFPGVALSLPYQFAAALAPVCAGDTVVGGFFLLWPAGRVTELDPGQIAVISDTCARLGELIKRAAERGRPITAGSQPRVLGPRPALEADPRADLVALELVNRLPEGFCGLDVDGCVTLISAQASDLLDLPPSDVVGKRLWEVLPWLGDPAYEDRYRAAVVGRRTTRFVARNPEGRQLTFELCPGLSGLTVRITPAPAAGGSELTPAEGVPPPRMIAVHDILRLATSLARAMTAQEVIDQVADHIMPVYDVQALAILTGKGGRLRVVASRGYSRRAVKEFDERRAIPPAKGDMLTPAFFRSWEELRETYPDAVRSDDMSAWAFLPLITSSRPIGTCVLAYDRPHEFSIDERASLTALAGLIAQAFERARLYDVKHQLAQCLQSSLLPRTLPRLPGLDVAARYVPATPGMDIGGDFYDLIRLSDTKVAAVIGDVQGHDVTAAALMGQVRTAVRAHATAGASPGEVLAHTNRLLTELAPDRFTSCLYVAFDLRRHTACLASAGHPPPILGRPGVPGQVVETSPGLLLGIDPDAEYVTADVPLPPDSVMILYTDGLIEEPGLDLGDCIAALAAGFTPSPHRPLHALADSLIAQARVERRTDDIALLLVRDDLARE